MRYDPSPYSFAITVCKKCIWDSADCYILSADNAPFSPREMIVRTESPNALLHKDESGWFHTLKYGPIPAFAFTTWQPIECGTLNEGQILKIRADKVYDIIFRGIELT